MTDKEFKTIRAVKNRLCRIDDNVNRLLVENKEEKTKRKLIIVSADIDGCVESLEKLIPKK